MGFRVGLAQCCHPADGNVVAMAERWVSQAKSHNVDLLVFPESLMTPFELSADDFAKCAEPLDGSFCTAMDALAATYGLWITYTANEKNDDAPHTGAQDVLNPQSRPYNTAVVVDDAGKQRAVYRKAHLFDTDFVRESEKTVAGSELLQAVEAPFGTFGVGICYDLRFPEQARAMAIAGCDLIVYPAAWVDGPRKIDQWKTLLKARAIENELFVAGLSRCDRDFGTAHRDYAGHSCVFGPLGEEVASAAGYGEELVIADIDTDAIARAREAMPILRHRELY